MPRYRAAPSNQRRFHSDDRAYASLSWSGLARFSFRTDRAQRIAVSTTNRNRGFADETTDPSIRVLGSYGDAWIRVVVLPPNAAPFELIQTSEFTIGRAGFAETGPVEDGRLSRQHARFRRKPDRRWELVDLDSTNGTFASGEPIRRVDVGRPRALRVGDTVMIAEELETPARHQWTCSGSDTATEDAIRRAASDTKPCLLLGPTGAGKTYLAEQIASKSPCAKPFISVNCGAIAPDLVDAELFGHAAGAFTGATSARAGLVESAHGGTLFLDEIGTLSIAAQAKLLTCIETGTIRRVGETRTRKVDVRYIAATNLELSSAISEGVFREDLYYRLSSHVVDIESLRRRPFDVLRLTLDWLDGDDHRIFTANALEAMLSYSWPGNVRELRNTVATLPPRVDSRIRLADLPDRVRATYSTAFSTGPMPKIHRPSKTELCAVLKRTGGNVSAAARELRTHRTQFVRWCKYRGVDASEFRRS